MSKALALARLSLPELEDKARALRRQLFGLRVQHAQRQLAKPATLRETRRELARVLTLSAQKSGERASAPAEKAQS